MKPLLKILPILLTLMVTPASADDLTIRDRFGAPVETLTPGSDGTYIRRGPAGEYLGTVTPAPIPGDRATIRNRFGEFVGTVAPDGAIRNEYGEYKGSVAPGGVVRGGHGHYKGTIGKR